MLFLVTRKVSNAGGCVILLLPKQSLKWGKNDVVRRKQKSRGQCFYVCVTLMFIFTLQVAHDCNTMTSSGKQVHSGFGYREEQV